MVKSASDHSQSTQSAHLVSSEPVPRSKKAAVVLAGCGHRDGAEVNEAVLTLLALRLEGFDTQVFAANKPIYHVIDHLSGEVLPGERRNMMAEAARIARGAVLPLGKLDAHQYDVLALPGGFGVAKNYSDFAFRGKDAEVDPGFEKALVQFLDLKKPVLAVCIAPAIVGLVASRRKQSLTMTLGSADSDAHKIMSALGHTMCVNRSDQWTVDGESRVISTPAYMNEVSLEQVWPGIQGAVRSLREFF